MFGDRAIIANATGCSSIYGGNLPTTPYTTNADGRGPAWSNSLFEDNAEFGFGMRLAVDQQTTFARDLLERLAPELGDELVDELARARRRRRSRDRRTSASASPHCASKLAEVDATRSATTCSPMADYLVRKSVWIVGGDGWAYDIGYGGLDHVLAIGHDVNILVLDTEVYSNTGGQQSKATPLGASAKFAIAGAGSGKTRTLTYRVAYLIENGVEPENILLLTFTNKASREMLERVGQLLPHDLSRLWGGTFHSVANKLLRRHANQLGFSSSFSILDRDDTVELVTACMREANWDTKNKNLPKASVLLEMISLAINKSLPIAQIVKEDFPYFEPDIAKFEEFHKLFRQRKKVDNVMDYDDLLANALELLRIPQIGQHYQEQFQHILVDEYQDTNKVQCDFIDTLASYHHQIMAVGDDAQSIYSWRGANFEFILNFPERYPKAERIAIEVNYRSTPEILRLANHVISQNIRQFPKNLRSHRLTSNPLPAIVPLHNGNQQALFIVQRIGDLLENGVELNDIAILYRSHFHSMELQMELTRRNVPYELLSGLRFFEQAHIKDVAAFLKFALNPNDEISFHRIAKLIPGVGAKTAQRFWSQLKSGLPLKAISAPAKASKLWQQWVETQEQILHVDHVNRPSAQIQIILEAIYEDYMKTEFPNYTARLDDLAQLRSFANTFTSTEEFLSQLALLTSVDGGPRSENRGQDQGPSLRLSTIHQAKGLEFKIVFVITLCEGLFPSYRTTEKEDEDPSALEEERRLFYVAVTRAKDELYLTYPMVRANFGPEGDTWQSPSRFLTDISSNLAIRWRITSDHTY